MVLKGRIVKKLDEYKVVVNIGYIDGLKKDMRFIIYEEGEEITDPETGESLGRLEIVKAKIKPLHVQERITIMESANYKKALFPTLFSDKPIYTQLPLPDSVKEGDLVREDIS